MTENKEPFLIRGFKSIFDRNISSYKGKSNKKKHSNELAKLFHIDFEDNDDCDDTPLIAAIKSGQDNSVIKSILEKEPEPYFEYCDLELALCVALQKHSKNTIKFLLNAGGSLTGCHRHASVIHCYLENPRSELREDILDLLLQRGILLDNDKSLMCFALSHGADVNDIKLLLRKGVPLNGCHFHSSPMLCLTNTDVGRPIKESVVKLLHDLGARVDAVDDILRFTPLEHALSSCNFEISAIKLLLDLQSIHPEIAMNCLLHRAVAYSGCNMETVKFLISQGIAVDNTDSYGYTPLHCAVTNNNSEDMPSIIRFLVEEGCPINQKNKSGHTPLRVAVSMGSDYEIFLALLAVGANIGRTDGNSILWFMLRSFYNQDLHYPSFKPDWFKLCVKFSFLRNKNFNVQNLVLPGKGYEEFCSFATECDTELRNMDSKNVGPGRTLRDFTLSGFRLPRKDAEVNHSELNQLLGILRNDPFPIYHEVIATRLSREAIIEKLNDVPVCSVTFSPGSRTVKKVTLNYACVCQIVDELHIDDILSMAAAFYVPESQVDGDLASGSNEIGTKRCVEEFSKTCKRAKMDYKLSS